MEVWKHRLTLSACSAQRSVEWEPYQKYMLDVGIPSGIGSKSKETKVRSATGSVYCTRPQSAITLSNVTDCNLLQFLVVSGACRN